TPASSGPNSLCVTITRLPSRTSGQGSWVSRRWRGQCHRSGTGGDGAEARPGIRLVEPKHTTMDCGECDARAKHALPLSQCISTCTACEHVPSRDKNAARVMLVRAGFVPAGVEGVRPERPLDAQAA